MTKDEIQQENALAMNVAPNGMQTPDQALLLLIFKRLGDILESLKELEGNSWMK